MRTNLDSSNSKRDATEEMRWKTAPRASPRLFRHPYRASCGRSRANGALTGETGATVQQRGGVHPEDVGNGAAGMMVRLQVRHRPLGH